MHNLTLRSSHQSNLTSENSILNTLYKRVREFRESGSKQMDLLDGTLFELVQKFPNDWLLRLELLEIYEKLNPSSVVTAQLREKLRHLASQDLSLTDMIKRGMELL